MGEEGGGQGYGVHAEFPAFRVALYNLVRRRGEESVAEKLVAETRAEDLDPAVMCVNFWRKEVNLEYVE